MIDNVMKMRELEKGLEIKPGQSVELKPGVPFPGSSLQWDRTRSSTDTCDVPRESVIAGGASYHLEVSIGDLDSKSTKQFLLF